MLRNSSKSLGSSGLWATGAPAGAGADSATSTGRGSSADKPLPSALRAFRSGSLFMRQNFLCELNVRFGAAGSRIIRQNRLSEARSFRQPDAARNHSFEYFLAEELPKVGLYLPSQVGA